MQCINKKKISVQKHVILASLINLYVGLLVLLCTSAFSFLSNIFFTPPELIDGFFIVPDPTISVNDLHDRSDDDLRRLSYTTINKFNPIKIYVNYPVVFDFDTVFFEKKKKFRSLTSSVTKKKINK